MLQRSMSAKSDFLGISASLLCILHCLALPVLVSVENVFLFADTGHWHGMDYLFIALGILAVIISSRNTNIYSIKLGLWLVISIFSVSILLHKTWPLMIYIST